MPTLPPGRLQRVEFCEAHNTGWTTNATAIGLTTTQMTALTAATTAARAAFNSSETARAASKAATENFYNVVRTLSDLAGDAIKGIKLKAATTNDPNIYVLANIPAPLPPSPPPPVQPPADLIANPNADGTISLRWKGSIANATFFSVWRKVGSSTSWSNIGSTALKTFIDAAVPASPIPSSIVYAVRSQRGSEISAPSVQAEVVYGGPGVGFLSGSQGGGGAVLATVGNSGEPGTLQQAA